jgi:hypothetical protein
MRPTFRASAVGMRALVLMGRAALPSTDMMTARHRALTSKMKVHPAILMKTKGDRSYA